MNSFTSNRFPTLPLTCIAAAVLLSACGGGSGGTTTGANSGSTTPPVVQTCPNGASDYPTCSVIPAKLQTSVPAPVYADVELANAFNAVNAFRASVGLGLWKQNTALDKATQNHYQYQNVNQVISHQEDPLKPGFTGVWPQDRAQLAGYASQDVGEEIAAVGHGGQAAIDVLLNTVYHREGLMDQGSVDFGIARGVAPLNDQVSLNVLNYGSMANQSQHNASDFVAVYPRDSQTNVTLSMCGETPNPVTDITSNDGRVWNAQTSFPVSMTVANGKTLSVTSFTIAESGQNNPLPVRLLTTANDPNQYMMANDAYLIGMQAFKPNTKYTASFSGMADGKAFSKSWSFTTGSNFGCR